MALLDSGPDPAGALVTTDTTRTVAVMTPADAAALSDSPAIVSMTPDANVVAASDAVAIAAANDPASILSLPVGSLSSDSLAPALPADPLYSDPANPPAGGQPGNPLPANPQGQAAQGSSGMPNSPQFPTVNTNVSSGTTGNVPNPGQQSAGGAAFIQAQAEPAAAPAANGTPAAVGNTTSAGPATATPVAQTNATQEAVQLPTATATSTGTVGPTISPASSHGQLPLAFEPNVGQTSDSAAQFQARGPGYGIALDATGTTIALRSNTAGAAPTALRLQLQGSDPNATAQPLQKLPGTSNYFIGNDPSQWHTNIPTYAAVQYANVYSGIDLQYYGTVGGRLEYTFVVHPGSSPNAIALTTQGATSQSLDAQGNLVLHTPGGDLTQAAPTLYQLNADGSKQTVAGGYQLNAGGSIGFQVGAYDASRTLYIDPTAPGGPSGLSSSTYLGGSGNDYGDAITTDSSGNIYITGQTFSYNFPTVNPLQGSLSGSNDVFVTKLNTAGTTILSSTYLGGGNSGTIEAGNGIAVDASGNMYVTGATNATDFPITSGAYQTTNAGGQDAFVAELAPAGNALTFSTYLGGGLDDWGNAIALDSSGQPWITGATASANFPEQNALAGYGGSQSAFLAALTATGSGLYFGSYLNASGTGEGRGLTLDGSGHVDVAGWTTASTLLGSNSNAGGKDAFVLSYTPGTGVYFSNLLGGAADDQANGLAVDATGWVYVTGATTSTDFPTSSALMGMNMGGQDAFITQLYPDGSTVGYSTYYGGSGSDQGNGITVDSQGWASVIGTTTSPNLPAVNAVSGMNAGGQDVFVTQLDPTGSTFALSTFLGGSGSDQGNGIARDNTGNLHLVGSTTSSNFPTVNAPQSMPGGGSDVFVSAIVPPPVVTIAATDPYASEAAGDTGTFTVSRTGDTSNSLTVPYQVGGDAVPGSDYAPLPGTVTIPAGSSSAPIIVMAMQDSVPEDDEAVNVGLLSGPGYTVGAAASDSVSVLAAPATPQVAFQQDSFPVMENAGTADIQVDLSYATPGQTVTVNYATADGTATAPTDYLSTSGTLTFLPGDTSQSFSVPINDDQLQNGDRSFSVTLSNPTNAVLGAQGTSNVTIFDDELPTVTVAATQPSAAEVGPVNGQFTFTRTGSLDNDVTVYYQMTGTAVSGSDYTALPGSIVLPAGIASATLTVAPIDDGQIDGSETAVLTLLSDVSYTIGGSGTDTVTIADDPQATVPVVSIIATNPNASETGPIPGTFTVTRTGSTNSALMVPYQIEGSAIPGTDYQPLPGSVTIPAGQSSTVITVNPNQDPAQDGYESVVLTLMGGYGNYALSNQFFAGVSISDSSTAAMPDVQEVHPLPTDFDTAGQPNDGLIGRILFAAQYNTSYHTVKKTTASNTVAQTQGAKVTITAYLKDLVANVPVYFEVIDPPDSPRYSNVTKKWDETNKDSKPSTIFDPFAPDHNIEKPGPDTSPNDNRDPTKNMQDDSLAGYNAYQKATLSQTKALSKIVMIDDGTGKLVKRAVAEVVLSITNRFSGDNYVVRATTVDPGRQADGVTNKPFNADSNLFNDDLTAKIPVAKVAKSALLTAWWRVYYELDPMYRVGADLIADATAGQTTVMVDSPAGVFKVNDKVRVLDEKNRETDLRTITAIDGNKLTLDKPLTYNYSKWDGRTHYGFVGRETGTATADFFVPDTSKLTDTFDDTFVEVVQLDAAHGSWAIPYYKPDRLIAVWGYSKVWFSNFRGARPEPNTFQLVGAGPKSVKVGSFFANGITDPHTAGHYNASWVWLQTQFGDDRDIKEVRDTTNHEIVHQFQWSGDRTGHTTFVAHDGSDKDLMNDGDYLGRGVRNRLDDLYELSLDRIYSIRDYPYAL